MEYGGMITSDELWYWNCCCSDGQAGNKVQLLPVPVLEVLVQKWRAVNYKTTANLQWQLWNVFEKHWADFLLSTITISSFSEVQRRNQTLPGKSILAWLPAFFKGTALNSFSHTFFIPLRKLYFSKLSKERIKILFEPIDELCFKGLPVTTKCNAIPEFRFLLASYTGDILDIDDELPLNAGYWQPVFLQVARLLKNIFLNIRHQYFLVDIKLKMCFRIFCWALTVAGKALFDEQLMHSAAPVFLSLNSWDIHFQIEFIQYFYIWANAEPLS